MENDIFIWFGSKIYFFRFSFVFLLNLCIFKYRKKSVADMYYREKNWIYELKLQLFET